MANGKGSIRRPGREISEAEWDRVFGPKSTFEWQPAPDNGPRPLFRPAEVIALPPADE